MDHPSTLPGLLHCRFNAIHRRASGTPHGDSDGKIDLRKRRVHLPGDKKRRETRESKWRARSFPPPPPSLSPPNDTDRSNDRYPLPRPSPLPPNFQPTISRRLSHGPCCFSSSNNSPPSQRFSTSLDPVPPLDRTRNGKRGGETHNLASINEGTREEDRGSQFPDSRPRRAP